MTSAPYANSASIGMIDFEGIGLANEIAQFSETEVARIEVGRKIGELCPDAT